MRRVSPFSSVSACLLVAILSLAVGSCDNEERLTEPLAPAFELLGEDLNPDMQRISDLITALFPGPGLLNAAEAHWRNIRRIWEGGNPDAARDQVVGFVNQALDLLRDRRLMDPDPGMGFPQSTEGVLAEMVMRLYAFVELSAMDAMEDFSEVFDSVTSSQDAGFGVIDPETGGVVTSANGWSRVTAVPGSTGELVFIQMELLDELTCEGASELTQSLGCWDIDRYPAGAFLQDVMVEICVADPGEEVMSDYEYYVAQRLHKQDETTLEIMALPLVNSDLDCTGFPLGEETTLTAAAEGERSLFNSLGSKIANLLFPDPLVAHVRAVRRPPRGLGGMAGSFTWFFGAVPVEPAYERLPIGTGPTASWVVEEPAEGVELCNAEGGVGCPDGSLTEVEISAVAEGTTAEENPPWWRVYLYSRPADESEAPKLIGLADYVGYTDIGSARYFRWTATLEGDSLPEGLVEVYALGVRHPGEGGDIFGTGLVEYITVVPAGVEPKLVNSRVGAGGGFSCSLRSDGQAFCWGANTYGSLGDGTQTSSATPVAVTGNHTFEQLFVGDQVACGLTASGSAYCWGYNGYSQLGAGLSESFSSVPVPVSGGLSFTTLSVGLASSCGVATNGVTYCWGNNSFGNLGNGTTGGESNVPVPVVNSDALGFVTVSSGFFFTCALDGTGSVFCWGESGGFGNDPKGPKTNTPTPAASGLALASIEVGIYYTCGIDRSDRMYCWGWTHSNVSGEQGNGSFLSEPTPTPVVGDLYFESLGANNNNTVLGVTCGITTTWEGRCWGSNHEGQLGGPSAGTCSGAYPSYDCSPNPIEVDSPVQLISIDVGRAHTCALGSDGKVYCWGDNNDGQLGDGTLDDSQVPVPVELPPLVATREVTPANPAAVSGGSVLSTATAKDPSSEVLAPHKPT